MEISFQTAEVAAGGSLVHSETLSPSCNVMIIRELTVSGNSAVGGTHDFGIYPSAACDAGTEYYFAEDWSGVLYDPVDGDGNGAQGGCITVFRNGGGSGVFHCKIVNGDSTDKTFTVSATVEPIPDSAYARTDTVGNFRANDLYVMASGNVGVNVSAPTQQFSIAGSALVSGNLLVSGAIGIGTASPSNGLHVKGAAPGVILEESDAGNQKWQLIGVGGTFRLRDLTESTQYPIIVESAPTNTLYLSSDGNVGLGTSNPSALLDVQGSLYSKNTTLVGVSGTALNAANIANSTANIWFDEAGGKITIYAKNAAGTLYSGVIAVTAV